MTASGTLSTLLMSEESRADLELRAYMVAATPARPRRSAGLHDEVETLILQPVLRRALADLFADELVRT